MILTIEGEGMLRRELSYDELAALPEQVTSSSVLFGGREVVGVRIASLLRLIHPPGSARFMTFVSTDGYSTTLPLAAAAAAILVIRIGEEPLTRERGGPVRLVTGNPDLRSSLKHVSSIRLTASGVADVLPSCQHHAGRAA
jgi:DMSO/TMAO reductase YedYZ molybdopterin-dependent catalytic subunit